jgi:hypothetical protein
MDRPRFQRVEGAVDELHRRYHGGGVVEAVFSLVDAWQRWRREQARRAPALKHDYRKLPVARPLTALNGGHDGPA